MRILWGATGDTLSDLLLGPLRSLAEVRTWGSHGDYPLPADLRLDTEAFRDWVPDLEIQLHPLQRLGIPPLEPRPWPLIAVADRSLLHLPQWPALLSLYSGWIALDQVVLAALQAQGARVCATVLQGWDRYLHAPHRDKIWPCLYLSPHTAYTSPYLTAALAVPEIHFQPQWDTPRLPQLIRQSQALLIDSPIPLPAHWAALASGVALLCPAEFRDEHLRAGVHYQPCTPDTLAETLASARPSAPPDGSDLESVWQRILAALARWPAVVPPTDHELARVYRLNHPDSALWAPLSASADPLDQLFLGLRAWPQGKIERGQTQLPARLRAWASGPEQALARLSIAYFSHDWRAYAQERPQGVITPTALSPLQWDPLYTQACLQGMSVPEALAFTLAYWDQQWQQATQPPAEAVAGLVALAERLPPLWYDVAVLARKAQQPATVARAFAQLHATQPLQVMARIEGVVYAAQQGDPPRARSEWQALADLLPRFPGAWRMRETLMALGRRLQGACPSPSLEVAWEGAFFSQHSFARINRTLVEHLSQSPDLALRPLMIEAPEYPPDWDWPDRAAYPVDILVSHCWPHRLTPPQEGAWAMIFPWEFGVIPNIWVEAMNRGPDEVWVPSQFVADSLRRSGVHGPQVVVIPNAVDRDTFTPTGPVADLPEVRGRCFLFVGGTLHRKGVDLLLKAWEMAFGPEDDATLVIKDFGTKGLYSVLSRRDRIDALQQAGTTAPIVYLDGDNLTDAEMAALYRRCEVYVHPYRGEGFGMPILEAMACGRPVIIPDAGPGPEFCPPEAGWHVPSRPVFESSCDIGSVGATPGYPFYSEVEVALLADTLRTAATCPEPQLRARGQAAAAAAQAYGWPQMAERVNARLSHLAAQPCPRRDRPQALAQQQARWRSEGVHADLLRLAPHHPGYWSEQALQALAGGDNATAQTALWHALQGGLGRSEALPLLRRCGIDRAPLAVIFPQPLIASPALELPTEGLWIRETPPASGPWVARLGPTLPADLTSALEVWYPEPWQEAALLAQGLPAERLWELPLLADFQYFHPQAAPLVLEESLGLYSFLALIDSLDAPAWPTLLAAFCQQFRAQDPVHLILKVDAPVETVAATLMAWIEAQELDPETLPALTLIQEPLTWERLPGLFTGCDTYLDMGGVWALAAQACGKPVISAQAASHVQAPYAYRYADAETLGHWLQSAYQERWQQAHPAVRAYLAERHGLHVWQPRIAERLARLSVQALLERPPGLLG